MTSSGARRGSLAGRVALVTGAARNIGAVVAERLAEDGAAVAINHRGALGSDDALALVERIRAAGGAAEAFVADVGDEDQVEAMVAGVRERLGPPSILINNAAAAVAGQSSWAELAVADWDAVLHTNVTGAFICAKAVYPAMAELGRGCIVQMSSVRVPLGRPGNVHYTSSKGALLGMTRVLAREMGPQGVTVDSIIVGAIRTSAESAYGSQEELDRMLLDLQAIKRRGMPADVAALAALASFLASDDASFITGQAFTVDCGWVMQ
ncbi:MAG: SDR family oxidoreductase [Chloroflexi bacterium]|nr:SDR family oxidoreductase [Chloroflexota bacterium]